MLWGSEIPKFNNLDEQDAWLRERIDQYKKERAETNPAETCATIERNMTRITEMLAEAERGGTLELQKPFINEKLFDIYDRVSDLYFLLDDQGLQDIESAQ